jgi:hypothetical protein
VDDVAAYLDAVLGRWDSPAPLPGCKAAWSSDLGFADTDPQVAAIARATADRLAADGAIHWTGDRIRLCDPEPVWTALRDPGSDHRSAPPIIAANNQRLQALLEAVDILITPTTPNRPHGHDGPGNQMSVALTWAFNISGHPAISVPAGLTDDGLPVGVQLIARPGAEAQLLQTARTVGALVPFAPVARQSGELQQ